MTESTGLRLPPSAVELIEGGPLGHVVTLNEDGSPHVTCVWVGIDDGDIFFASMFNYRKTKNLMRDPRVALSVESLQFHGSGLRQYLTVTGRGEVVKGGAFDLIRKLANVYIAPGAEIPPAELKVHPGYVTRIHVEEIGGVGPWAGDPPKLPSK
ncbi:TIGR03618 family F420-dependent PPOX class oxidoreductase [Kutzneria kofuensis]|uniref:PPOX class probable F420-dependent enzyme n=1 Tax=Kutzneria kofuensis TaxID=103725 RepID=A0A7W9NF24_9PSEU|nr:TIGR03618 family F420-dependent PPOX class oxidoreductase [Kutzneria kofuensis]MBB5890962.1 PPOX class probable F420-dependent enzyme [Kutzneria kofuensis]